MCIGPKAPKPPKIYADPAYKQMQLDQRAAAAAIRADNKRKRTEEALGLIDGRMGRGSLLTGGRGGGGYGAPVQRSLFVQNG